MSSAQFIEMSRICADLIDNLEGELAGYDGELKIGTVAVVAEIHGLSPSGVQFTDVGYKCNDDRRWIHAGLMEYVARAARGEDGDITEWPS